MRKNEAERNRYYDKHQRDPAAQKFYHSRLWKTVRTDVLSQFPVCQKCGNSFSEHVHHKKPLKECSGPEKIDRNNLLAVCKSCHNSLEAEYEAQQKTPIASYAAPQALGMLTLTEDATYYFDPVAAEKPIIFIEKHIKHTEGKALIGKPFLLEDIQKFIIRQVYGFKHRETHLRRFNKVWFEAAVGAGKSPYVAAIGVYELLAGDEPCNQMFSMAADYAQAKVIFDQGKRFINANPVLKSRCVVRERYIKSKTTDTTWEIISGKGPKAGRRPGWVSGDEAAQWKTAECYNDIQARMTKKDEGIFWLTTNAAETSDGIYWQLHQQAVDVLAGKRKDDGLYPIIWAADAGCRLDDPEQWKKANPLIGVTIKEHKIREECEASKGSPYFEARFRRMYLGQHVQSVNKWINLDLWSKAAGTIDPDAIKGLPLYVGWDGSGGDDLCSAIFVWVAKDRYYIQSRFWLPKVTAQKYEKQEAITYQQWSESGHITLLDETTITPAVQERIASEILEVIEGTKFMAFAYDQRMADPIQTAIAKKHPDKTVAIRQGYTLNSGCVELDRRLKEGSITIQPNEVLNFCARNVEVTQNEHNQIWPVKPGASKSGYAGRRHLKIDGISAAVTAITEIKNRELATPCAAPRAISLKDWKPKTANERK